jgi:hypothetical protein
MRMQNNINLTVVVNSSDGYSDCWDPFFTLLKRYWPELACPIVLNTESKAYKHDGLNVRASQVAVSSARPYSWSECLHACLDTVVTEYVLYLQEDYFLESRVRHESFLLLLDWMQSRQMKVLRLMECDTAGPWQRIEETDLVWRVADQSNFLLSLQASIWNKAYLISQLRPHETPWQLEYYGSKRIRRHGDAIYAVNRDKYSGPGLEILPYIPTGVIGGKWQKDIVSPLFEREKIAMDFSMRGFYDRNAAPKPVQPIWKRVVDRIRSYR